MSVSSDLLGAEGPGVSVTIDGKTWVLTRSTRAIQAAWSKWLTDRAEERAFITSEKLRERAITKFAELRQLTAKYEDVDPSSISPEENERLTLDRDKLLANARALQAESRSAIERFNDRVAAGEFEYYGTVAIDLAQQGLPGQMQLVYLCLKPKHPDVTMDDVIRAHMPNAESGDGKNHIDEWRDALLKSEGVRKKDTSPKSDSSTSTQTKSETPIE